MRKKKLANMYLTYKHRWDKKRRGFVIVEDPDGYLFSGGIFPTRIRAEDLPEWYVFGYMYKCHGYLSAKGVKYLKYRASHYSNHMFKDDFLYISYDQPITEAGDSSFSYYVSDECIYGGLIITFLEAVEKYSDIDLTEIKAAIEEKRLWLKAKYPDDYAREVGEDRPYFE